MTDRPGGEPHLSIYEELVAGSPGARELLPPAEPRTRPLPTPYPRLGARHGRRRETEAPVPPSDVTTPPTRKLGRRPEDLFRPRLRLGAFLRSAYKGDVPDAVDYSRRVADWPMFLNDRLSTCTAADAAHAVQLWTAYGQDAQVTPTDEDVLAFYSASTGYDPRRPETDRGGTMQEVNDYFRKHGMAGRTIEAFFRVDTDDLDEVRAALYLFGAVSVGMAFPAYAMEQFDAGQPWDLPTGPRNDELHDVHGGHDVLLVGARKGGNLTCVTWGRLQEITPAFWAAFMGSRAGGEAWARVETDWASKTGVAPGNALHVSALNDAFRDLTGKPGPFPTAPPAPHAETPAPAEPTEKRGDELRAIASELEDVAGRLRSLADL